MRRAIVFLVVVAAGAVALRLATQGLLFPGVAALHVASEAPKLKDAFIESFPVPLEYEERVKIGGETTRQKRTIEITTDARVGNVDLPFYRKDASGRQTSEAEMVVRFERVQISTEGELLLLAPRLTLWRPGEDGSDRVVEIEITSAEGLIEKGRKWGNFWGGVRVHSTDGETRSYLETERALCYFDEKQARTEEAVFFKSGRDLDDPDFVIRGKGMEADLVNLKLRIDREGTIDLVERGKKFHAPLPGLDPVEGERGDTLHLEAKDRIVVERTELDEKTGLERYEMTLEQEPVVSRAGTSLAAKSTITFKITGRRAPEQVGAAGRKFEIDYVKATFGVVLSDARADRRNVAEGEFFVWKRTSEPSAAGGLDETETATLKYDPRLTMDGTGGFGEGPKERDAGASTRPDSPTRTVITSRGNMVWVRRSRGPAGDLAPPEPPVEFATFEDDVRVDQVETGSDGSSLADTRQVLETDHLEIDFEPSERSKSRSLDLLGGPDKDDREPAADKDARKKRKGPRIREVRAQDGVVYTGPEGEARGDRMKWTRFPTRDGVDESHLFVWGNSPSLRLLEIKDAGWVDRGAAAAGDADSRDKKEKADLLLTCKDRMEYQRRVAATNPDGTRGADPDDEFRAFRDVRIEKIPLDAESKPVPDSPAKTTLDASDDVWLLLAARPAPEAPAEAVPAKDPAAGRRPFSGDSLRVRTFVATGNVRVRDPDGHASADRLRYEIPAPESEVLDLEGQARAWSRDGFVSGNKIHYFAVTPTKPEESGPKREAKDEVTVYGNASRPAVVWQPVDSSPAGEDPLDPENPPPERHWIEARERIDYDRIGRVARAEGEAFCRLYAQEGEEDAFFSLKGSAPVAPPAPREADQAPDARARPTPWVLKARQIVATLAERSPSDGAQEKPAARDENPAGVMASAGKIEKLVAEEEVHIYSLAEGKEPREARGGSFEYDERTKTGVLKAASGDPNARAQVWQGADWIRGRQLEFQRTATGGVVQSTSGGQVEFTPDEKDAASVDPRAPKGPVSIQCRGPIRFDRATNVATFETDVIVRQGTAELRAQALRAEMDTETRGLRRAIATVDVLLTLEDRAGRGTRFEWDVPARSGVLTGTPQASARVGEEHWVQGNKITYALDSSRVIVDGQVFGRTTSSKKPEEPDDASPRRPGGGR